MAPLNIFALMAFAATTLARPHGASTGAVEQPHASHHAPSPLKTGAASKSEMGGEHAMPSQASGLDMIGDLLGKAPMISGRDVEEDCTSTVTTKLQVTVTVTADDNVATGAALTLTSHLEQKQVYTTTMASSASSRRHGHHSSSGRMPSSGVSASMRYPSSGMKPSHPASSQVASSQPASSIAAVQSTSTAALEMPLETYAMSSILSATTTIPAASSSAAYSSTVIPVIHSSAVQAAHVPATIAAAHSSPATTAVTYSSAATTTKTTSSAQATSTTSSSSGKGKRGLAYNLASLTQAFASSSQISWAYNWASSTSGLPSDIMYIPTLWGNTIPFTASWKTNAQAAIASGSTHLFSFNEPDMVSQANLSPAAAAAAYKTYMHDMFGGSSTKLCAPAISNGGGATGLTWLKNFMDSCTDCQIDCINLHWYGTEASDFQNHIKSAIAMAGGKEIWVTEFALTGSPSTSASQTFLQSAMSFMDSTEQVAGYSYFMVTPGSLITGTSVSTLGSTYMG